jgi:hypothetical protein
VTRYQILYWQQVPSLVRVLSAVGSPVSHQLPEWFQQEIDRQAMEQGLAGSNEYLAEWRWGEVLESPEPIEELIRALVTEFGQ